MLPFKIFLKCNLERAAFLVRINYRDNNHKIKHTTWLCTWLSICTALQLVKYFKFFQIEITMENFVKKVDTVYVPTNSQRNVYGPFFCLIEKTYTI